MSQKFTDRSQVWISWLAIVLAAGSFYLSLKGDRDRSENLSVTVEPIWSGYMTSVSDRSLEGWYSLLTHWRVVAVNTSDRPLSIISYQISGNKIGYPMLEKGLYDKKGERAILPLDIDPGESITFTLHVGLWIDQRVYEFSYNSFNKSESPLIEELRENLLQSHGIDFFGNNMTTRGMYLPGGRAILYPEKGFEDRQIEIQFVTARRNTFTGVGRWYDYEAIKKQDIGADRDKVFGRLLELKDKMSNKIIQPTPRNGAAD